MFKFFLDCPSLRFLDSSLALLADCQRNTREARTSSNLLKGLPGNGKAFLAYRV